MSFEINNPTPSSPDSPTSEPRTVDRLVEATAAKSVAGSVETRSERPTYRGERPSFWLRPFGTLLVLIVAIMATHAWVPGLELQGNDYEILRDADRVIPPVVMSNDAAGSESTDSTQSNGDRATAWPTTHFVLTIGRLVFGVQPTGFHAMSLGLHVLATWCLYLVLVAVFYWRSPLLPFLAAVAFAIHPGKLTVVAEVGRIGEIGATLLALLALRLLARHREAPQTKRAVFSVLLVVAAMAADDGAFLIAPMIALLDRFILRPSRGGDWRDRPDGIGLGLAICFVGSFALRFQSLGGDAIWPMTLDGPINLGAMWDAIRRMPEVLRVHLAGGERFPTSGPLTLLPRAAHGLLLVGLVVWAAPRPVRRSLAVLFAVPLYIFAITGAMPSFDPSANYDPTRRLYLATAVLVVVATIPLVALTRRLRPVRWFAWAYAAVILTTWSISFWRHADAHLDTARTIARIRQELVTLATSREGENVRRFVIGLPTSRNGLPLFGDALDDAFRPPHRMPAIPVDNAHTVNRVVAAPEVWSDPAALQVVRWVPSDDDRDIGRFEALTDVIPAPVGHRPQLEIPASPSPRRVLLDPPLVPRDVRALRLRFAEPLTTDGTATLRWTDEADRSIELPVEWNPALGTAPEILLPIATSSHGTEWLRSRRFRRLEVEGTGPFAAAWTIETDATLPSLSLLAPENNTGFDASDDEPDFRFEDDGSSTWYRLVLTAEGRVVRQWTVPRGVLRHVEGTLAFRLSMTSGYPGEAPVEWVDGDQPRRAFEWHIEGYRGQLTWPQAKSERRSIVVRGIALDG